MILNPKKGTVLLIGGNLICGTVHKRALLSGIPVAGALVGNSPFSLACRQWRWGAPSVDTAVEVDRCNGLDAWLRLHPAEFAVVDLHYVCMQLFSQSGHYYTKFPGMTAADLGADAVELAPKDLPTARKKQLIERYADILRKHFRPKNIVLIQTRKSEFFVVGDRVRQQDHKSTNQLFQECEKWFQARTRCSTINTLQFYYLEKKPEGTQYEKEAYLDLADNIQRFVRREHIRRRPIFRYSLDRYCRYYDNLYKKAFGAFLRKDNAIENLVYSSQPAFIQENYELLRAAERLLIPGYRELAVALDPGLPNAQLLKNLLITMDAVLQKDYVNPNIPYSLLFDHDFTLRELWKQTQEYARKHWKDIFPEQVTEVNYGYYFAKMQLELTKNDTICAGARRILEHYEQSNVPLKPLVADLLGSCVSRLNFQYDTVEYKSSMVLRGNLFQALPIFWDGPKVVYNPLLFLPGTSADNLVVQTELDNRVSTVLDQTGSDWLVVDLYTLTAKSIYRYQGKIFCDNGNHFAKRAGAEKITLHKDFTQEALLAQLDRLADYVQRRYGSKVILIKHKRMTHYVDYQGKIRRFSEEPYRDSLERNPHNDVYTNYFAEKTGCYYIDIVDQFLSDEMNLLYLNTVHYENAFYDEVRKLMHHIMLHEPAQKHYTDYTSLTRVRRIASLCRQNPGDPVLSELFCRNWLDSLLLKLDPELVQQHAAAFTQLYDENCPDLQAAIARSSGAVRKILESQVHATE